MGILHHYLRGEDPLEEGGVERYLNSNCVP